MSGCWNHSENFERLRELFCACPVVSWVVVACLFGDLNEDFTRKRVSFPVQPHPPTLTHLSDLEIDKFPGISSLGNKLRSDAGRDKNRMSSINFVNTKPVYEWSHVLMLNSVFAEFVILTYTFADAVLWYNANHFFEGVSESLLPSFTDWFVRPRFVDAAKKIVD